MDELLKTLLTEDIMIVFRKVFIFSCKTVLIKFTVYFRLVSNPDYYKYISQKNICKINFSTVIIFFVLCRFSTDSMKAGQCLKEFLFFCCINIHACQI